MKRDKTFVLVAVSHDGLAPAAAHYDLKNDPEVVAAAVKQDGRALQHASQRWREDQKLQVMAGNSSCSLRATRSRATTRFARMVVNESITLLPSWFGELKGLTSLNLQCCESLQSLPERFGQLTSLSALFLDNTPAGRTMPVALKAQLGAQGCKSAGNGW